MDMSYMKFAQSPLIVWIVQLVIACFFTAGYLSFSTGLWQNTFHNTIISRRRKVFSRIAITVTALGIGSILHFIGYVVGNNAVMYHNIGLFILVLSLFDDGINIGEYLIRAVWIAMIVSMHYMGAFESWRYLIGMVGVLVVAAIIGLWQKQLHYNAAGFLGTTLAAGIVFWLTIPYHSAGMMVTPLLRFEALIMYAIMAVFTFRYQKDTHTKIIENRRIEKMVNYDALTDVQNYASYQHEITDIFQNAKLDHTPLTFVAIDIDHFKQVNDNYGHLAGNNVLVGFAKLISDVLDEEKLNFRLYRTGGEEFILVFLDHTPQDVTAVLRNCIDTVRKSHFEFDNQRIDITISVGVTQIIATDQDVEDLYKRADENLYRSKRAGRDSITIEGRVLPKFNSEAEILNTHTFFVQHVVNVPDHTLFRNELLLRRYDQSHERWVLPPSFDISVDIQIDLMKRVLQTNPEHKLSINLTMSQFADPTIAHKLVAFNQSADGPNVLVVEIIEVPNLATMRAISQIYHDGGVYIEIDDVGSDNSYELVKDILPYVTGVKFAIQNLRKDNDTEQMNERIRFWHDIAVDQNLFFILEGVETEQDMQTVNELGINYVQGYFFGKPHLPQVS